MQTKIEIKAATGSVRSLLRAEGLALFIAATLLYLMTGGVWWIFALLIFAPDLSFLGYAGGNRVGAAIYNAAHSYIVPVALGLAGVLLENQLLQHLALIHLAHIGLDRALGYGLKYASGFKDTHLGELARRRIP
ncbi:DUF4260 domain-containing protein [Devosia chinhatensis]|uniref:DUF4260 domain-containing protein n=1 Tax=Devosia chinhatensis TaxID=429727 RepID=A0A0F5FPS3_9HYPH|nr:DUF4260 domain-containing protein [Devosia chinhatensis]KKB10172.1 hypothetical protein VE26_01090 [Devosia chinhatensis]